MNSKVQDFLTSEDIKITIKYDDRETHRCYVAFDEAYAGFGSTIQEAVEDYVNQELQFRTDYPDSWAF